MTRAKFQCVRVAIEKDDQSYHAKEGTTEKMDVGIVELQAVTGGSDENKEFFASTPNGKIELRILRPEAVVQFERGKYYYVDFTAAESQLSAAPSFQRAFSAIPFSAV